MLNFSTSRKSVVRDGFAETDIWGEGNLVTVYGALDAPESIPSGGCAYDYIKKEPYQTSVGRPRAFD